MVHMAINKPTDFIIRSMSAHWHYCLKHSCALQPNRAACLAADLIPIRKLYFDKQCKKCALKENFSIFQPGPYIPFCVCVCAGVCVVDNYFLSW